MTYIYFFLFNAKRIFLSPTYNRRKWISLMEDTRTIQQVFRCFCWTCATSASWFNPLVWKCVCWFMARQVDAWNSSPVLVLLSIGEAEGRTRQSSTYNTYSHWVKHNAFSVILINAIIISGSRSNTCIMHLLHLYFSLLFSPLFNLLSFFSLFF